MLRAGGVFLVCNHAEDLPEAGYTEAFGAWFLVYRDDESLDDTARSILDDSATRASRFSDSTGRIAFLELRKN